MAGKGKDKEPGSGRDKQRRKKRRAQVKTIDGATYTIMKRPYPEPDQRTHYWVGDNGAELELTEEEASALKLT